MKSWHLLLILMMRRCTLICGIAFHCCMRRRSWSVVPSVIRRRTALPSWSHMCPSGHTRRGVECCRGCGTLVINGSTACRTVEFHVFSICQNIKNLCQHLKEFPLEGPMQAPIRSAPGASVLDTFCSAHADLLENVLLHFLNNNSRWPPCDSLQSFVSMIFYFCIEGELCGCTARRRLNHLKW